MAPTHSKVSSDKDKAVPCKSLQELIGPPAILLQQIDEAQLEKHQAVSFELRTSPKELDSQTHGLSSPFFNTGTPEEWLKCCDNIQKVNNGQNAMTGAQQFTIARRALTDEVLAMLHFVRRRQSDDQ